MKRFLLPLLVLIPVPTACSSAEEHHQAPAAEHASVLVGTLEPSTIGATPSHALGGITTAGQPSAADLAAAKASGIRTVVNMRHEDENTAFDERAVVEGLGLRYVSLPWNGPEELTDDVFARSRAMFASEERPLLVHCGSANRVGAVWLAWRVLDGGVPYDEALVEARTVGLKTPAYLELATDYIRRHGGKT